MKSSKLLSLLFVGVLSLFSGVATANPCAFASNGNGGIGGTGISTENGVGGTGISDDNGLGGTGHGVEGGVGGTGKPARGVGGTGQQLSNGVGGTGQKLAVIGVVTGFASVCVNGIEVHYDDNTSISINGETASPKQLAVGQIVSISAETSPKGWNASSINTNDAVAGPVTKFLSPNRIEVLGQTVNMSNELAATIQRDKVAVGQTMRVQGVHMANGEIFATNAIKAPVDRVVLTGQLKQQANGLGIGGVQVTNVTAVKPNTGQLISVTGRMVGRTLQASNVRVALPVDNNAQQLSVQSTVDTVSNGSIQLGNGTIVSTSANVKPGSLVYLTAQKDKSGNWKTTQVNTQTQSDLLRKAGLREDNSGKGSKNSKRGKTETNTEDTSESNNDELRLDTDELSDDDDGSSNSGSSNSGSSNSGSSNSGSSNSGSSNSGSGNSNSSRDSSSQVRATNAIENVRIEKTEKLDHNTKVDKIDKIDKIDKVEKIDKVDRIDKVEKIDRIDKVDRVEKVEKIDRVDRVDRVEKVEKIDKVEKVERIDRVDTSRPSDRPTVDDRGGSGKGRSK